MKNSGRNGPVGTSSVYVTFSPRNCFSSSRGTTCEAFSLGAAFRDFQRFIFSYRAPQPQKIHAGFGRIHLHPISCSVILGGKIHAWYHGAVLWNKHIFHIQIQRSFGLGWISVHVEMCTSKRLNQAPPSSISSLHFNKNKHGEQFDVFRCTTCFSRFLRNLAIAF